MIGLSLRNSHQPKVESMTRDTRYRSVVQASGCALRAVSATPQPGRCITIFEFSKVQTGEAFLARHGTMSPVPRPCSSLGEGRDPTCSSGMSWECFPVVRLKRMRLIHLDRCHRVADSDPQQRFHPASSVPGTTPP